MENHNQKHTALEITVDNTIIKVKEFQNYAGEHNFFAVGYNGNLYYNNNPNKIYTLLSPNFQPKSTPPANEFGIIEYDRRIK